MRDRASATNASGYTLLELLVVLAILALIATIATPRMSRYAELGNKNALRTQIATVSAALRLFHDDVRRFPTDKEGLAALLDRPAGVPEWAGPYLSAASALQDPWGHRLIYRLHPERASFVLSSDHEVLSNRKPDS